MDRLTYNPCDECPYGIDRRDGSGNGSMCKICEFKAQQQEINRITHNCHIETVNRLKTEITKHREFERVTYEADKDSNTWHYVGDGDDHIEALHPDCVVFSVRKLNISQPHRHRIDR